MRNARISVALVAAAIAAGTVSGCTSSGTSGGGGGGSTAPSAKSSVSHGIGSKDASKDVTLGKLTKDPTLGLYSVPVTVVNHSSKRSDYLITIALESADGSSQVDTATVVVQNLEPGQTKRDAGQFTAQSVPAGAKLVLQSVDRTASV